MRPHGLRCATAKRLNGPRPGRPGPALVRAAWPGDARHAMRAWGAVRCGHRAHGRRNDVATGNGSASPMRQGGRVITARLQGGRRREGRAVGSPRWAVADEAEGVGRWQRSTTVSELWWSPVVPEGSCSTGGR
jgi:hypothetical protein